MSDNIEKNPGNTNTENDTKLENIHLDMNNNNNNNNLENNNINNINNLNNLNNNLQTPNNTVNATNTNSDGSLVGMIQNLANVAIRAATTKPLFDAELPTEVTNNAKTIVELSNFRDPSLLSEDMSLYQKLYSKGLTNIIFSDLFPIGYNIDGKVERLQCNYYRLFLTQDLYENGFLLHCKSFSKDKFKLLVFNDEAQLLYCDNSRRSKDKTVTNVVMYCNPVFDTYELREGAVNIIPAPLANAATNIIYNTAGTINTNNTNNNLQNTQNTSNVQNSLPYLFTKIETFESNKRIFPTPGYYLIGVFGENFVGRSSYQIVIAPTRNTSAEVQVIQTSDTAVIAMRHEINQLKDRYLATKAAYEATLMDIDQTNKNLDTLIAARDLSYRSFVVESLFACNPYGHVNVVIAPQATIEAHNNMQQQGRRSSIDKTDSCIDNQDNTNHMDTPLRGTRIRRDSLQEVSTAAQAVANKASENLSQAVNKYSGWMNKTIAAGTKSWSNVRASFVAHKEEEEDHTTHHTQFDNNNNDINKDNFNDTTTTVTSTNYVENTNNVESLESNVDNNNNNNNNTETTNNVESNNSENTV